MAMRSCLLILLSLLSLLCALFERTAGAAPAQDARAQIVESSLRSLSEANDAAIGAQEVEIVPSVDALGAPRTALKQAEEPSVNARVRGEVESSLHRLRRETVIVRTPDPRRTTVEESLRALSEAAETEVSATEVSATQASDSP